jgi:hypothetical protein
MDLLPGEEEEGAVEEILFVELIYRLHKAFIPIAGAVSCGGVPGHHLCP